MNKVKVDDFVNAFSRAMNLTEDVRVVLVELMENIIQKYEKIIPNIPVSLDDSSVYVIKPINGKYSVEDFFLNRLMRSVWEVSNITERDIKEGFANEHTKGQFRPEWHSLNLNQVNLSKQTKEFKTYLGNDYEKYTEVARKKVIMHEFEHALQTRYDDKLDWWKKPSYKGIIEEIEKLGKYSNSIRKYQDFSKEIVHTDEYLFTSTHISSTYPNKDVKTYMGVSGAENLCEILNESESLEMSGQLSYLNISFEDGNQMPYRNPESSNGVITNYGDLFKLVFGKRAGFNMMYLNPIKGFEDFNKNFNEIFQNQYKSDKDAIEIFITAITNIKNTNSEEEHLKLTSTLAKCLEKRIKNASEKVSNDKLIDSIKEFKKYSIKNADKQKNMGLEHVKIISSLNELILKRKDSIETKNIEQSEQKEVSIEFVEGFINAYDITENEYQRETRTQNEKNDIERVKYIAETGFAGPLVDDIKCNWIIQDDQYVEQYSQKQVSAMARLLKAAKKLTENEKSNSFSKDYLSELTKVPDINHVLNQMRSNLKKEGAYMHRLREEARRKKLEVQEEKIKVFEVDSPIKTIPSTIPPQKLRPTVSNWQVEEQKRKEDQERYRKSQEEKRKREEEQRKKMDELKKQREQQQLAELRAMYEDDSYNPTWHIDNENKNTNGQRHGMRH